MQLNDFSGGLSTRRAPHLIGANEGVVYENTIKSALHWKRVCRFFVSGIIEINRQGTDPFELDYGEGECDAIAVLRRGDEEKEIILRYRHRIIR